MKILMTVILSTMLIKSTTSASCNLEKHEENRWISIECSEITSPSQIQFTYIESNFKQVLSVVNSSITKLPPKGFLNFSIIDELWLKGNQIQELEAGALKGLVNLQYFYIDSNNLTEVPEGVFTADLDHLLFVDLGKNNIRKIEKTALRGVASLNILQLKNNKIAKLEKETFSGLAQLRVLRLDENLLTEFIDYDLFGNSTNGEKNFSNNLGFLYLGKNRIKSFAVKNLKQLQLLDLTFNQLSFIEPDSFAELSELRTLHLSDNFLKQFSPQLLAGKVKLEYLYLSRNNINNLERGVFHYLFELVDLDMSNNSLTEFNDFHLWGNAKGVVNVGDKFRDIRLANNSIASVSLSNCKTLKNVYLQGNNLSRLNPDNLKDLTNMEELDISDNYLKSLPLQLFQSAVNLNRLFLNNIKIAKLECGVFRDLKKLQTLGLAGNLLEEFNDCCLWRNRDSSCNNELINIFLDHNLLSSVSLVNSSNIQHIHLEHNNFSSVKESSFDGLRYLESLDLSNNIISKFLPNSLKGDKNLLVLNLESNKIRKLEPGTFSDQTKLAELNAANNLFVEFKTRDLWNGYFKDVLETLDLSKNLLKTFLNPLSKNLKSINLSYNKLSYLVSGMFRNLNFLTTINLSHNNIPRISSGVFERLKIFKTLNLSSNRLKKFDHYIFDKETNLVNLDLSNNQIDSFVIQNLNKHLPNLQSVNLFNNSFTCGALAQLDYQLQNLGATLVRGEAVDVQNVVGIACDP